MDGAARAAFSSLQANFAHCQLTVRGLLEWLAVQSNASSQVGPSGSQDNRPPGSVDPDYGSYDSGFVRI